MFGRYNFHKLVQYKQLTLEEAEEQMKNRRRTADGYQRWMMKAANTGAAAFGDVEKVGGGGLSGRRRGEDRDLDEDSDKGEEDEDEEEARKSRLGMNKGTKGGDEDGDDPARGEEMDFDDEDAEKGDDWEHEETFTDDDEAVGNDPEEREDQLPEVPAPPEIKQEEGEEDEGEENQQEEGGGLSKSGRELKKLLGKATGLDDSDADEDEEEDEDVDLDNEDIGLSPVFAPKRQDAPKDEPSESPVKVPVHGSGKPTQASTSAKGKRKAPNEEKVNGSGTAKKTKVESTREVSKSQPVPTTTKKEPSVAATAAKAGSASSAKTPATAAKPGTQVPNGVTEEEVKMVLQQTGPLKSQELVAKFKNRLKAPEDRNAFAVILKKISRIQKKEGTNFIVLRDKV
ncbi:hypothetical protein O6H91_03G132800 [Diphasiastrum complanatum]|uniref:Uncharacterized protein n=1 Tax=Diphasiastrum complanatum TaxID=34168 RepID=A0ACC2EBW7_DIPCM|nr:hypothetical protein O6H91_03G132800 [Diphasiastrum complanatum]